MNEVAVKSTGIVRFDPIAAALADLEGRLKGVVHEVATAEGMLAARKDRAEVRRYRVALEKARVDEKAEALEYGRKVDSTARQITSALLALEEPIDQQIKAQEEKKEKERAAKETAERERVSKIHEMIGEITKVPYELAGRSAAEIRSAIETLGAGTADATVFAEFTELADAAFRDALARLSVMLTERVSLEEQQARLAVEKAELARQQEEQRQRDAEAKRVRDEEQARIRKEQETIAARQMAEQDRLDRERREHQEKLDREAQARAAAEAREQAEAARKLAEQQNAKKQRKAIDDCKATYKGDSLSAFYSIRELSAGGGAYLADIALIATAMIETLEALEAVREQA